MEARYIRMLSSLCAQTYAIAGLTVREGEREREGERGRERETKGGRGEG